MAKDAPEPTLEERIGASIDKQQVEAPKKEEKKEAPKAKGDGEADDTEAVQTAIDATKAGKVEAAAQADGADEEEDEEKEKPDEKTGDEKKEPDDEEEEEDDDEITPEFKQALAKQRLDFKSLEGLTKKEKAVVLEHATRFNRAFTKVQMEAASFRKDKAAFETEKTYQSKNPDRHIADLLTKEPDLLDKVNKELERRQNPIYAEALEKDRAADKKLAEAAVAQSETKAEELQERIATLEASTTRAAKEAGLPDEFAQEAVANAILQKRVAGEEANLTDAEISDIIESRTAVFNKHVGAHRAASTRAEKNKYVKEKAEDAKGKTPKPKGASTERKTVAGVKPENVADFTSAWLDAQGM